MAKRRRKGSKPKLRVCPPVPEKELREFLKKEWEAGRLKVRAFFLREGKN